MFGLNRTSDLNTTEFTPDQRAVLIANKNTVESFLEKLMTVMINSKVSTREDIAMCREMKDYGINMLDMFKEENDRK